MNDITKKLDIIKNVGIILGVPFLIVIGVKLYNIQLNTMAKEIDYLKQTSYDKAASLLKSQKDVFNLEREQYEEAQRFINVLVKEINNETDLKKKKELINNLRLELDESYKNQKELNEKLLKANETLQSEVTILNDQLAKKYSNSPTLNSYLRKLVKSNITLTDDNEPLSSHKSTCWKISIPIEKPYKISSRYGRRKDPVTNKFGFHSGIDYKVNKGEPVYSSQSGTVVKSGNNGSFGVQVVIRHNNDFISRYNNLFRTLVNVGEKVNQGEIIALAGNSGRSTGPHLHFELSKNGKAVNPLSYLSCNDK